MRGRTAVYEILHISDTIRQQVLQQQSGADIKRTAMQEGMSTMRDNGIRKVLDLTVAPEEALRVLSLEEL
jgi:type II secretory ATPase GspE/PulE/Tfp pilus assembly ATPase PilB-like protein